MITNNNIEVGLPPGTIEWKKNSLVCYQLIIIGLILLIHYPSAISISGMMLEVEMEEKKNEIT